MSDREVVESEVTSILDAHRAASIGGGCSTLVMAFAYAGQGLAGEMRSATDLVTGCFVETSELGRLRHANGFDGVDAWLKDPSGAVIRQSGGDTHRLAISAAYRNANLWWRPDRGGAKISALPQHHHHNEHDVLLVAPEGGTPFEAWFARGTHVLSRIVEQRSFQIVVLDFTDYRRVEGALLPHRMVIDRGNGPDFLLSLTLRKATFEPAHDPSFYAAPVQAPAGDAFPSGTSQSTIPFSLVDNHIYAEVFLNAEGPFRFIIDTAGHNIISPGTAAALGLKIDGKIEAHGSGDSVVEAGFVELEALVIGHATVSRQIFYVLPLPSQEVEGSVAHGVIGFETFMRFVIRIDYAAATITLFQPHKFEPHDAGARIDFRFYGHVPEIDGTFEGLPCKLDIDTGSRCELTLTRPFVDAHALRTRYDHSVLAVDGWGIGGPVRSDVVSAAEVKLGSVAVRGVITGLATQDSGTFADPAYHGNVGSKLLKRFVVTFDYSRRHMYLEPRSDLVDDTGTFDRAGMWINAATDGFEIIEVTACGPAALAGLKAGDRIVSVDGQPADGHALPALRRRLRNDPVGDMITFSIRFSGETRSVTITLKDQV